MTEQRMTADRRYDIEGIVDGLRNPRGADGRPLGGPLKWPYRAAEELLAELRAVEAENAALRRHRDSALDDLTHMMIKQSNGQVEQILALNESNAALRAQVEAARATFVAIEPLAQSGRSDVHPLDARNRIHALARAALDEIAKLDEQG